MQKYNFKTTTKIEEAVIFTEFRDLVSAYINEYLLDTTPVELINNPKNIKEHIFNAINSITNYLKSNNRYTVNCYNVFKETALNNIDDSKIIFLFDDNKLIGFQSIYFEEIENLKKGYIVDTYINKDYRKTNVFLLKELLINQSEDWFIEKNVDNITVNLDINDDNNLSNYLKLGFVPNDVTKNNNVEMVKTLDLSLGQKKLVK
jgi:hypothetical protein